MALTYYAQWLVERLDCESVLACLEGWLTEVAASEDQSLPNPDEHATQRVGVPDGWTLSCERQLASGLVSFGAYGWDSGTIFRVKEERPEVVLGQVARLPPAPSLVAHLLDGLDLTDQDLGALPRVLVSVDAAHPRATERLTNALTAHLRGMAAIQCIEPATAAELCVEFDLRSDGRMGTVFTGVPGDDSEVHWRAFPATSAVRDPEALARAIQSRLLSSRSWIDDPRLRSALAAMGGGRDDDVIDDLAQIEAELASRIEALQSQLVQVTLQRDEALDDLERLEAHFTDQQAQMRRLERLVWSNNLFDLEDPLVDEEEFELDSCVDVVAIAPEVFDFVTLTARQEDAEKLDEHPKRRVWAERAWRFLRGLNDYARLKANGEYANGLAEYCKDPPPRSFPLPWNVVALGESESVQKSPKLSQHRLFQVPRTVNPAGHEYMFPHIKIDNTSPAPRIHFLEGTSGGSHVVVVGYFGKHLPTARYG